MFFALWVPGAVLLAASVIDLKRQEIPDGFPIVLICWAILATACGWLNHAWWQVLLGAVVGLSVGALSFRFGGLGGGDAKLLAGLGATLGPVAFLFSFVFIAVAGGLLAVIAKLRHKRQHAYAPAIAAGYIVFITVAGVTYGWL